MNTKKVVFFDIDGTLYAPNIGIPASTVESLRLLKENGVSTVICTGRARSMVPQSIIDLGFDGIIAGAGTYVEVAGQKIYEKDLDFISYNNLVDDIFRLGLIPILEGHAVSYYDNDTNDADYKYVLKHYFDEARPFMKPIPKDYSKLIIAKVSARFTKNGDNEGLMRLYNDKFNICCHGDVLMEFIPKHSSKAVGISEFLKHTGIQKENTYAYGDSMNDYEMLQFVQYGVAMGNSCKELLDISRYKTDTIECDGIYNSLKAFKLI